jgi:cytochrome c oxidase subunit 2
LISKKARRLLVAFGILLTGAATGDAKHTIEIILQKSYYSPSTIEVSKGEAVRLSLKSLDVTHGFAIDQLGIAREISPGPPTVITLPTSQAGTYTFYCVVRCGKDHLKMRGTLIIKES